MDDVKDGRPSLTPEQIEALRALAERDPLNPPLPTGATMGDLLQRYGERVADLKDGVLALVADLLSTRTRLVTVEAERDEALANIEALAARKLFAGWRRIFDERDAAKQRADTLATENAALRDALRKAIVANNRVLESRDEPAWVMEARAALSAPS